MVGNWGAPSKERGVEDGGGVVITYRGAAFDGYKTEAKR
jgi:hypothetical protein